MRIVVCGSISENGELIEFVGEQLRKLGHSVYTPRNVPFYPSITVDEKIADNLAYRTEIRNCDAIYVVNRNRIGLATAAEIGQAIVLNKKIFLYEEPKELELQSYIKEGIAEIWRF